MKPLDFAYDDGGRQEAGYIGYTGDCACRAVAIALQRPYQEIYRELSSYAQLERPRGRGRRSHARTGYHARTLRKYLADHGWNWHPTMQVGQGCQTHLRANELPRGRLITQVSKHYVAVIDGTMHDISDPSRNGTRCVYGYWSQS